MEAAEKWAPEEGEDGAENKVPLEVQLSAIIGALQKEADQRTGKRQLVEQRWLDDLKQYHGRYDDGILKDLAQNKRSQLFINQTRPKTNACEAKLGDMLFPTDDKNWGVRPSPVPELTVEAESVAAQATEAKMAAAEDPENPVMQEIAEALDAKALEINLRMDEAKKRARSMEQEIDDHLKECRYAIQARDVIRDACRLGTGIMKGPVVSGRNRSKWVSTSGDQMNRDPDVVPMQGADDARPMWFLQESEDARPVFWRVDPWNFFPDMDATSIEDCESVLERHLMTPKELRKLSRQPGFKAQADAFRRLLTEGARSSTPTYISDLRSITGAHHDSQINRYHVWEYHGPMSGDDLAVIAESLGDTDLLEEVMMEDGEIDPLAELQVAIWFCQGALLKVGIHHLDSGESIYSVFNLEKDEAGLFGFGVPYLMRDSQKSLNAAWRAMMDNAGIAGGPQIEIDEEVLEPADGEWVMTPRKVWKRKRTTDPNRLGMKFHKVDMHQTEMANIINISKQFIDEETSISTIAQGEQGSHTTQTAHGMSLLMNATNVVFRRIVKNWDDDMTTPTIRRMYDFLMQFSKKDHIKGDYEVDARGTSVLLVREMQATNLMGFIMNFAGHPVVGRFLKQDGLPALRKLTQTLMIPADEVIKTNEEVAEDDAANASAPPQPDPATIKLENEMNLASLQHEHAMELEQFRRETSMIQLAEKHNMTLDQLRAKLQESREKRDSDERKMAVEAAVSQRQGPSGGGHF